MSGQEYPLNRPADRIALRPLKLSVWAGAAWLGLCGTASAFQIPIESDPDWSLNWDHTVQYNLGLRAGSVDSRIGNSPVFAESDYKFAQQGDVVTNRLGLVSEFDASYQRRMGVRLSASAWKDFAYDDHAKTNPGTLAMGPQGPVGYVSNYDQARYSGYTRRYYLQGAQLLDAFAFINFDLADQPSALRLGRLTQFWGNALFFSALGVSYSQSASDLIKASAAPGTQAKELALPRAQLNVTSQVSDDLSLRAQYFFEYQPNRLPEGGTFLAPVDFLFAGPDKMGVQGLRRADADKPPGMNGNFGLQARWAPEWLDGTAGVYFRRFDETQPWSPIFGADANGTPFYRLAFPTGVKVLGLSLEQQWSGVSVGMEMNYRHNTGLNTNGAVLMPSDVSTAHLGARGNTLNWVINGVKALDPSAVYDGGTALLELGHVRKLKLTEQADRYKGVNMAACDQLAQQVGLSAGGRATGCSTDNAWVVAGLFEPQWLQALPSLDVSLPMFAMYGLKGNAASNGVQVFEHDLSYTFGVKLAYEQRYNLTMQYNGYHGEAAGLTNAGAHAGVANGTPGFATYYASGNNLYSLNDRAWWSLTFSSSF